MDPSHKVKLASHFFLVTENKHVNRQVQLEQRHREESCIEKIETPF